MSGDTKEHCVRAYQIIVGGLEMGEFEEKGVEKGFLTCSLLYFTVGKGHKIKVK